MYKRQKKNNAKDSDVKDGVELSICLFNTKEKTLKFSAAGHKLLVVSGGNYVDYKGDAIPLGELKYSFMKKFNSHTIKLKEGDCFYLFSDGVPDQKGGEKGKKLYYKPFYQFLESNANLACNQQAEKLEEFIQDWKKDVEQYDDMLVLGFKV